MDIDTLSGIEQVTLSVGIVALFEGGKEELDGDGSEGTKNVPGLSVAISNTSSNSCSSPGYASSGRPVTRSSIIKRSQVNQNCGNGLATERMVDVDAKGLYRVQA
jgi:hypothetical protein